MIEIRLPEWENWRIAGEDKEFEVQRLVDGKNGPEWRATNYFSTIEGAIGYAYERTLRESPKSIAAIREVHIECEKVKSRLIKAVRKAVAS